MPIRPHTASKAQETAEAIQTALTQRSLDVHDVRTWARLCAFSSGIGEGIYEPVV